MDLCCRDKLREQQALANDIAEVITSTPFGEAVDEGELEDELANLEQETIDERMVKTGTIPVADQLNRLPVAGNGERTSFPPFPPPPSFSEDYVCELIVW